jgi:hypothetical protein
MPLTAGCRGEAGRHHRVCPGLGGNQRFRPDGIDFASAK